MRNIKVEVYRRSHGELSLASLLEIAEGVPEEFKDSIAVEVDGEGSGYDDDTVPVLVVTFTRPQTEAEAAEERLWADKLIRQNMEREIATLRALRAKYPSEAP